MSFQIKFGNLFDGDPEGFVMHGCNAQGVMGSGVARIIKDRYFQAFKVYAQQHPHYILGEVIPVQVEDDLVIINAITQDFYGTGKVLADYDAIRQAMNGAVHVINSGTFLAPPVLHMPFIGAGLAGGDPHTIFNIMREELDDANIAAHLWLYDKEHVDILNLAGDLENLV